MRGFTTAIAFAILVLAGIPSNAGWIDPHPTYEEYEGHMNLVIDEIARSFELRKEDEDYARSAVGSWMHFRRCRGRAIGSEAKQKALMERFHFGGVVDRSSAQTSLESAILAIVGAYYRQHGPDGPSKNLCRFAKEQGLPKALW